MPPPTSLQSISCFLGLVFPHYLQLDFALKPDRHERQLSRVYAFHILAIRKEPLRTVAANVGTKAGEEVSFVMFQNRLEKILLVTFVPGSKLYLVAF